MVFVYAYHHRSQPPDLLRNYFVNFSNKNKLCLVRHGISGPGALFRRLLVNYTLVFRARLGQYSILM